VRNIFTREKNKYRNKKFFLQVSLRTEMTQLFGDEWRKDVPPQLLNFSLPHTDDRTTFIACSTYKALKDKARYHLKLTQEEMESRAKEAIDRDLVDMHSGNDKVIGKIVAAAVDAQHRMWVVGAVNYSYDGNLALSRMRNGHYWGVSWRMQGIRYLDPIDKDICVEKSLVNLSPVPNPEYDETKIYYIAEDPFPVRQAKALHNLDKAIDASLQNTLKKQSKTSIPNRATVIVDNTTIVPMSAVPTPVAAATAAASSTETITTPPTTTANVIETPKKVEPEAVATQTEKKLVVEPTKEQHAVPQQSIPAQQQLPPTPQQHQPYMQPPNITYNFGLPFTPQNQFATPSTAQQTPLQATPDQQQQQQQPPMSTPATQEKPIAAATPAAAATPVPAAAAAATPAAAAPTETQQGVSVAAFDEFRRTFANDMKSALTDALKAIAPQQQQQQQQATPAQSASSSSSSSTAPPPVEDKSKPAARPVDQINTNAVHDAIFQLGQMQDELAQEQNKIDSVASMVTNEQRLNMQQSIDQMKAEIDEHLNTLVEAVETHQKNYRETFKVAASRGVDGEIARMKQSIKTNHSLSKDDLKYLGMAMEFTSESSGAHRRVLEAQEQQLQAARAVPTTQKRWLGVQALREVFNIDPRSSGTKRSYDSSQTSSSHNEMPPPQQVTKQVKLDPTQQFQKQTGLAWKIADRTQITCYIPPPPSRSLNEISNEFGMSFYPVDPLPNSLWAKGLDNDPDFAPHIQQGVQDAIGGVKIEPVLSSDGWNRLKKYQPQELN